MSVQCANCVDNEAGGIFLKILQNAKRMTSHKDGEMDRWSTHHITEAGEWNLYLREMNIGQAKKKDPTPAKHKCHWLSQGVTVVRHTGARGGMGPRGGGGHPVRQSRQHRPCLAVPPASEGQQVLLDPGGPLGADGGGDVPLRDGLRLPPRHHLHEVLWRRPPVQGAEFGGGGAGAPP